MIPIPSGYARGCVDMPSFTRPPGDRESTLLEFRPLRFEIDVRVLSVSYAAANDRGIHFLASAGILHKKRIYAGNVEAVGKRDGGQCHDERHNSQ